MTRAIDEIRDEILKSRNRIRSIIESAETQSHIESCERMVDNWSLQIEKRLDSHGSFLFKSTSCWRSVLELHLRVKKSYECLIAQKKAKFEMAPYSVLEYCEN